jgi:hypothetical protein
MTRTVTITARLFSTLAIGALIAGAAAACTSVLDLNVGDCYDGDDEGEVSTVQSKACTEPHDAEVYANITHPESASAYPGRVAVQTFAEQACIDAFTAYVGIDFDTSALNVSYLTPTEDGWNQGDKVVTCVLTAPVEGEKLTGSMKDSRR